MCLGIPAQVVRVVDARRRLAEVDVAGVRREVCLACVCAADEDPAALIDSWVLVHVGFAMARIAADEAAATLALLSELGESITDTVMNPQDD